MMSNVVKLLLLKQRQSLFALCSARKETYKNGVGNFCSQGQDVHQGNGQSPVSFKDRLIQKHFHPKEHEGIFWSYLIVDFRLYSLNCLLSTFFFDRNHCLSADLPTEA